jgi:DNA-binding MarR family transcriptional regulator
MAREPNQHCAANVMETFHLMMRAVGREARARHSEEFPIHQFRALITIKDHEGASLSQVSEHLGASVSAASKVVDGLVDRGYVLRKTAEQDRRKLVLALTEAGEEAVNSVKLAMHQHLAEKLVSLSPGECAMLNLAMDLLRSAMVSTHAAPVKQPTQQSEQQQ